MRTVHCTRYGPPDVLTLREAPKPIPKPGQVLIRIHAAGVTLGDCEIRAFKMVSWVWVPARIAIGITKPRQPVLGMEVAGVVESVGEGVTRFKPGDRVFGPTGFGMGAYADYAVVPEAGSLTTIPPQLSYAEAAGIPTGGLNGLHFVRKCDPKPVLDLRARDFFDVHDLFCWSVFGVDCGFHVFCPWNCACCFDNGVLGAARPKRN